jgi:hypothetical protein
MLPPFISENFPKNKGRRVLQYPFPYIIVIKPFGKVEFAVRFLSYAIIPRRQSSIVAPLFEYTALTDNVPLW